jgi:hypothetical protein
MSSFVVTPTAEWLARKLRRCRDRFIVCSPYVGSFLPKLTHGLRATVTKHLLTRADLRDFAVGASDGSASIRL